MANSFATFRYHGFISYAFLEARGRPLAFSDLQGSQKAKLHIGVLVANGLVAVGFCRCSIEMSMVPLHLQNYAKGAKSTVATWAGAERVGSAGGSLVTCRKHVQQQFDAAGDRLL